MREWRGSFIGGTISPDMRGLVTDAKYQAGLAHCENFIVKPRGAIENRAGFALVREAINPLETSRLFPFQWSTDQTLVIEMSAGVIRFHTEGKTILKEDGSIYELAHDYRPEDIFGIHYAQSNDVLTLVHPNYPPRELKRLGATNWTLTDIQFSASQGAAPAADAWSVSVTGFPNDGGGSQSFVYRVAFMDKDGNIGQWTETDPIDNLSGNYSRNFIAIRFIEGLNLTFDTVTITDEGGVVVRSDHFIRELYMLVWCKYTGGTTGLGQWRFVGAAHTNSHTRNIYLPNSDEYSGGGSWGVLRPANKYCAVAHLVAATWRDNVLGYLDDDGYQIYPEQLNGIGNGEDPTVDYVGYAGVSKKVINTNPGLCQPPKNKILVIPANGVTGDSEDYAYKITYVFADGSESIAAALKGATNNLNATGAENVVHIDVGMAIAAGARSVNVYRKLGGLFGYLGSIDVQAGENSFADSGDTYPDTSKTPPQYDIHLFNGEGNYPAAVSYHNQRRFFGGTLNKPQSVWASKTGTESDMSFTVPASEDDSITLRPSTVMFSHIRHLVPLNDLFALSTSAEFRFEYLASGRYQIKSPSYIGASDVSPLLTRSTFLFVCEADQHVYELGINDEGNYGFNDTSIRATVLFDGNTLYDAAYTRSPDRVAWFPSSSGALLGFTYYPEQQISAWHHHTTHRGRFLSCASVIENGKSALYVVVERVIGGAYGGKTTIQTIERMADRTELDNFLDMSLVFDSADPVNEISGDALSIYGGEWVTVVADGCVIPPQKVESNTIYVDVPARHFVIGFAYTARATTLPVAAQLSDGSMGGGHRKDVSRIYLLTYQTRGTWAGIEGGELMEAIPRYQEPMGSPPDIKTEEIEIDVPSDWTDSGQVTVEQRDPLPLSVLSLNIEYDLGG